MRIFLSGVGGVGISALALMFHKLGFEVAGSDLKENRVTKLVAQHGIRVIVGQHASNITKFKPHLYVYTSALPDNHPELTTARGLGIPTLNYAQALGLFSALFPSIGVAGAHGKTTTTALISYALLKQKATFWALIGALFKPFGNLNAYITDLGKSTATIRNTLAKLIRTLPSQVSPHHYTIELVTQTPHMGKILALREELKSKGIYFVFEADEYKNHILNHTFEYLVIPGLNYDHPDFFKTPAEYYHTFQKAAQNTSNLIITYPKYKRYLKTPKIVDASTYTEYTKHLPTLFLQKNGACAVALLHQLGYQPPTVAETLQDFPGVWRRFEILTERPPFIINDYAHNPQKIYYAAKALSGFLNQHKMQKGAIVWEPHQYARTLKLKRQFFNALTKILKLPHISRLYITNIYPSRDPKPIQNQINTLKFIKDFKNHDPDSGKKVKYAFSPHTAVKWINRWHKTYKYDAILVMSAGTLGELIDKTFNPY